MYLKYATRTVLILYNGCCLPRIFNLFRIAPIWSLVFKQCGIIVCTCIFHRTSWIPCASCVFRFSVERWHLSQAMFRLSKTKDTYDIRYNWWCFRTERPAKHCCCSRYCNSHWRYWKQTWYDFLKLMPALCRLYKVKCKRMRFVASKRYFPAHVIVYI